jgi:glycosyltransferase involved in cell wall biosynthesis
MQFFISKTGIPDNKIHIIPIGYEPDYSPKKEKDIHPPSIGFFNRVSYNNGFDKIVDSFINLKVKNLIPDLTLNVGGGYTNDDRPFILSQIKKIKEHGFKKHVRIFPDFMGNKKREFFNSVDIISVPVNKYDGYGLYILEANYAGIPVVQPATGAFPEILNATGGGIIYSPDTVEELSSGLRSLLTDSKKAHEMGERGKEQVRSELSLDNMAGNLSAFYNQLFL